MARYVALLMAALRSGKSIDLNSMLTSDLTWQLSRRTTMMQDLYLMIVVLSS